jgi:hypothetical protein
MMLIEKCPVLIEGQETRDENGVVEQSLEITVPKSVGGECLRVSIRVKEADTDLRVWNPFTKKWIPFLSLISH